MAVRRAFWCFRCEWQRPFKKRWCLCEQARRGCFQKSHNKEQQATNDYKENLEKKFKKFKYYSLGNEENGGPVERHFLFKSEDSCRKRPFRYSIPKYPKGGNTIKLCNTFFIEMTYNLGPIF